MRHPWRNQNVVLHDTADNCRLPLRFGTYALARAKATFLSVTVFCLRKNRADANVSARLSYEERR